MTVHSSTAGTFQYTGFSLTDSLMSMIDAVSVRIAARRRYRAVKAELEDFEPEQLADLGISDADIERVAEAAARLIITDHARRA